MAATGLDSRAVIGQFFYELEQAQSQAWTSDISMFFLSDQPSESYKWLGQSPALREWVGGRQAKGLTTNGIDVANLLFESTLEFDVDEVRRDKTGQIDVRIAELAGRAVQHWAQLLSTLIVNGDATVCYDGQFFFDTDHVDPGAPNQTSQDNDLTSDISALPVALHGSTTAPSVGEMSLTILATIEAMLGFQDNQGQPINDGLQDFMVMTPVNLWSSAVSAVGNAFMDSGQTNPIPGTGLNIDVQINSRLTDTDVIYVFRKGGPVAPFIRQGETPTGSGGGVAGSAASVNSDVVISALAEGSEEEFKFHRHLYGVTAQRNVAYGYWQYAVRNQLV